MVGVKERFHTASFVPHVDLTSLGRKDSRLNSAFDNVGRAGFSS